VTVENASRSAALRRPAPSRSCKEAFRHRCADQANSGGEAIINSVSCASADHCSSGGQYTDSSDSHQAFVVNET
jgi:hypothetical protein